MNQTLRSVVGTFWLAVLLLTACAPTQTSSTSPAPTLVPSYQSVLRTSTFDLEVPAGQSLLVIAERATVDGVLLLGKANLLSAGKHALSLTNGAAALVTGPDLARLKLVLPTAPASDGQKPYASYCLGKDQAQVPFWPGQGSSVLIVNLEQDDRSGRFQLLGPEQDVRLQGTYGCAFILQPNDLVALRSKL